MATLRISNTCQKDGLVCTQAHAETGKGKLSWLRALSYTLYDEPPLFVFVVLLKSQLFLPCSFKDCKIL